MGDVGAQSSEKRKRTRSDEALNEPKKFLHAQFSILNKVSQSSLLHILSFVYRHRKRCQKPFFFENNTTKMGDIGAESSEKGERAMIMVE